MSELTGFSICNVRAIKVEGSNPNTHLAELVNGTSGELIEETLLVQANTESEAMDPSSSRVILKEILSKDTLPLENLWYVVTYGRLMDY